MTESPGYPPGRLPGVLALDGVVRNYAWGSPTLIPQLRGDQPDGRPVAELWFGAHADDPAHVVTQGVTLDTLIAADPKSVLGMQVAEQFGDRLPFLVKLLAAERALSIQVHPDLAQARRGFAAEDDRRIARDAPERNYRDANHKPELLCALTPFDALCGFRPVTQTLQLLDAVACPELEPVSAALRADDLRGGFDWLLRAPEPDRIARSVAAHMGRLADDPRWAGAARSVALIVTDFPDDIGVALSLLLNDVRLEPGEAIYLGAGNVHCYLRGMGVEVMANSDNVLRCGLTPKHVDVDELMRITDFTALREPRLRPAWQDAMGADFEVPVPDFRLSVVDLDGYRKPGSDHGSCAAGDAELPYLVLCTSGQVEVTVGRDVLSLTPGGAAFVPARTSVFTLRGTGRTFLATAGAEVRGP